MKEKIENIDWSENVYWYASIVSLFLWKDIEKPWSNHVFLELNREIFWSDDAVIKKLEEKFKNNKKKSE